MSQNATLVCRLCDLPRVTPVKHTFRDESEQMLCNIAYVLHLTRTVKQSILEDKVRAAK